MSILKDYYLCEDLTRLNHQEYFQVNFDTPELTEALTTSHPARQHRRNLTIYLINMAHTEGKSVYVVIKWLLVAHKTVRVGQVRTVREIGETIGKMGQVATTGRYEGYLLRRLIRPYKKYLQKMCHLIEAETNGRKNQQWFMKFNLIQYALSQFCPVFGEFIPFLTQHYPFLGTLSSQIGQDLSRLVSELKNSYKSQDTKLVGRHQIEQLEEEYSKMGALLPSPAIESLIFTDSECCPGEKVMNFFESASKTDGSVLF